MQNMQKQIDHKMTLFRVVSLVYLGPAENGTNANGSLFSTFSGKNLSGLYSYKYTVAQTIFYKLYVQSL